MTRSVNRRSATSFSSRGRSSPSPTIAYRTLGFDRLTCGKACSPAVIEANRHHLELDIPPIEQYQRFVSGIFFGRTFSKDTPRPIECEAPCLGYSFLRNTEVLTLIARAAPVTFWLAIGGFLTWMVVGLTLGIVSALKRGRWIDRK